MPRLVGATGEPDSYDMPREALAAVRARWWLVPLVPLLVMAVVAAHSLLANSAYEAEVGLAFEPPAGGAALRSLGLEGLPPPSPAQILSDSVLRTYRARSPAGAADPRSQLRVRPTGERQATLIAETDSSRGASALADEWRRALVATLDDRQNALMDQARAALERRLAASGPDEQPPPPARAALQQELARLDAARRALRPNTEITRRTRVTAQSADRSAYLWAGGGGLLAGLALAVLAGMLDRRIRSAERLAAAFGLPLLGRLRQNGNGGTRGAGGPDPAARLYARLVLHCGGTQPPTVLVTGVAPGADTALAAYAVAAAIVSSGKDVALVGWHPEGLKGRAQPDARSDGRITLIEDGSPWPNFLLRIADLSFNHEAVVVCAPPLAEAAESLQAAQAMSAWLVCAQVGQSKVDNARSLRAAIGGLRQPPAGLLALSDGRGGGWSRLLDEAANDPAPEDGDRQL